MSFIMDVSEVMSKVVVIDDKVYVRDAVRIMSDKNIGSLIVISDGSIKGIITERDVLKNINKVNNKLSSIMSKRVITIEADADVKDAVKLMVQNKIKRIPVLDKGKLVGLVSVTDLIAYAEVDSDEFIFN